LIMSTHNPKIIKVWTDYYEKYKHLIVIEPFDLLEYTTCINDKMGEEKRPDLNSWKDFAGDYIKAEFIDDFPAQLPVVDLAGEVEDGRNKMIAEIEHKERSWKFDLNKTNQNFIRSRGLKPIEIIGRILIVEKIKVRNPSTNNMVNSLIITNII